jgi:flagellar hook-associated protein 2
VIQGVTLNLAKTNSGSTASITVARDAASVTAGVGAFVKAYNDITKILKEATAYNPTTKQAAILNGESSVRSIESDIRKVLSTPVVSAAGAYTLLFQVGVSMQKDGLLALDSAKLQGAIDKNFSDIATLFAAVGKAEDSLVSYSSATAKTVPGAYNLNVTQLATNGKSVGSTPAGLTIAAGSNDTVQVLLDGVSATVALSPGTYATSAALAAEVQARINSIDSFITAGSLATVSESAGVLTITSSRYGLASKAGITGGNGMSNLMGTAAVTTDGLDIAGSINGVAAVGNGQFLTAATGNPAEGLQVKISGGSTGSRGTISYSQGYAYQFDKLMEAQLGTVGMIASRTEGINASLKNLADSKERVADRLSIIEKRYRTQFTALDVTISSMQLTGNFLTQQLANLSNNQ